MISTMKPAWMTAVLAALIGFSQAQEIDPALTEVWEPVPPVVKS